MWQQLLQFDQKLFLALHGSWGSGWDTFFHYVSAIPTWFPLYLMILVYVWLKGGPKEMIVFLLFLGLGLGISDQLCNFFKTYTPKFRPTHNPDLDGLINIVRGYRGKPYGTVSGHTALSMCIALYSSLYFRKTGYTIFIFLWACLVAYSRVYIGAHFPFDLFFGTIVGLTIAYLAFQLFIRVAKPKHLIK